MYGFGPGGPVRVRADRDCVATTFAGRDAAVRRARLGLGDVHGPAYRAAAIARQRRRARATRLRPGRRRYGPGSESRWRARRQWHAQADHSPLSPVVV